MVNKKQAKIVYIDVGTHFGQEFLSFFGDNTYFYHRVLRRIFGFFLFKSGIKIDFAEVRALLINRRKLRAEKDRFFNILVEANPRVFIQSRVYKLGSLVFNCALTGDEQPSIQNLYLANNDSLSQGSSIFLSESKCF